MKEVRRRSYDRAGHRTETRPWIAATGSLASSGNARRPAGRRRRGRWLDRPRLGERETVGDNRQPLPSHHTPSGSAGSTRRRHPTGI